MVGIIGPALDHDGLSFVFDPSNSKCKIDETNKNFENPITGNKSFGLYGPVDSDLNHPYGKLINIQDSNNNSFFPALVDARDPNYEIDLGATELGLDEPNKIEVFDLGRFGKDYAANSGLVDGEKGFLINDNLCNDSGGAPWTISMWWARDKDANETSSTLDRSYLFGNAHEKIDLDGTLYDKFSLQCLINVTGGTYPLYNGAHVIIYSYDEYEGETYCNAWNLGDFYESFVNDVPNPRGFYNTFNNYIFTRNQSDRIDFYWNGNYIEPFPVSQSNLTDWGIPGTFVGSNARFRSPVKNFRIGGANPNSQGGQSYMSGGLLGHTAIWNKSMNSSKVFNVYNSQVRRYKSGYQGVFSGKGNVDLTSTYNNPNYYRFVGSGPYTGDEDGNCVIPVIKGDDLSTIEIGWSLDNFNNTESEDVFSTTSGSITIPEGATSGNIVVPLQNDDILNTSRSCDITLSLNSTSSSSGTTYGRGSPYVTTLSARDNEFLLSTIGVATTNGHLNVHTGILTIHTNDYVRTYSINSDGTFIQEDEENWPTYSVAWSSDRQPYSQSFGSRTTITESENSGNTVFTWARGHTASFTDNYYYFSYPGAFRVTVSSSGNISFAYSHSNSYKIRGGPQTKQIGNTIYARQYKFTNTGSYDNNSDWYHWTVTAGESFVRNVTTYSNRTSSDNAWNNLGVGTTYNSIKNLTYVSS